jgi:hypothetical protein
MNRTALWALLGLLLLPAAARADGVASNPLWTANQAQNAFAVTASDSANLPQGPTSALYNGNSSACNIKMMLKGDSAAVTWDSVQPGQILPVRAIQVYATGTTCSNLVALYTSQPAPP